MLAGAVHRPSISAFFPCYNDAATITQVLAAADETLAALTDDYELIVVNDGSEDASAGVLESARSQFPRLRIVTHQTNRGYGGALRSGFAAAGKELVFYTDGDGQYDPHELRLLWDQLADGVDVVQGFKIGRQDGLHRKIIGRLYHHAARFAFGLHLRDVDCDFRLIRRSGLDALKLTSNSGSITVELMAGITQAGLSIVEVPVHHYARVSGRSHFFKFGRIAATLWQLAGLWFRLRLGFGQSEAVPALAIAGGDGD